MANEWMLREGYYHKVIRGWIFRVWAGPTTGAVLGRKVPTGATSRVATLEVFGRDGWAMLHHITLVKGDGHDLTDEEAIKRLQDYATWLLTEL